MKPCDSATTGEHLVCADTGSQCLAQINHGGLEVILPFPGILVSLKPRHPVTPLTNPRFCVSVRLFVAVHVPRLLDMHAGGRGSDDSRVCVAVPQSTYGMGCLLFLPCCAWDCSASCFCFRVSVYPPVRNTRSLCLKPFGIWILLDVRYAWLQGCRRFSELPSTPRCA